MTTEDKNINWAKSLKEQIKTIKCKAQGKEKVLPADPIKDAIFYLMRQQRVIVYGLGDNQELAFLEGAVEEITGYQAADLLSSQLSWGELVMPEDQAAYNSHFIEAQHREVPAWSYRIITQDGNVCWLSETLIRLPQEVHGIKLQGIIMDVTEQRRSEHKYLQRQAQLDNILSSVQDVIWSVAPDSLEMIYANPAAKKVFGYDPDNLLAGHHKEFQDAQAAMLLDNYTDLLYKGEFAAYEIQV